MTSSYPRRLASALAVLAVAATTVLVSPATASADAVRDKQWYLNPLKVLEAQQLTKGEGITIGIVDSGVDATHPDLEGSVLPGVDLLDQSKDGLTPSGDHGTSVASILVGHDDANGVLGIAPAAKLISVRDSDASGKPKHGTVQEGIRWLADHGADVISLSIGDPAWEDGGQEAVDYAISKNIIVVAGAGNVHTDDPNVTYSSTQYPAAYRGVIAVTGTTPDGGFWDGSVKLTIGDGNFGISAPATDMLVALSGGGYEMTDGTSFATPIVAGTMALVKAKYPNLNQRQLLERLLLTADDKGDKGEDLEYGWGIANPYRALTDQVDYLEPPTSTVDPSNPVAVGDNGSSGGGIRDFVPVIVSGGALLVVVGIVVLVVRTRSRRKTAALGPSKPQTYPPPPGPPGPESRQRPPGQ